MGQGLLKCLLYKTPQRHMNFKVIAFGAAIDQDITTAVQR
jgi:hypothetical protein